MSRGKLLSLAFSLLLVAVILAPLAAQSENLATPLVAGVFTSGEFTAKEAETVNLTILHLSDIHSELLPWPVADYKAGVGNDPTVGGIARLATLVNQIVAEKSSEGEAVLLLVAGDFLMGTPFTWIGTGATSPLNVSPELHLLTLIGGDKLVVGLGNHEFDYTEHGLATILNNTNSTFARLGLRLPPILCSNLNFINDVFGLSNFIKPNHIMEVTTSGKSLKVGFFAVIGYNANKSAIYQRYIQITDPVKAAREQVEYLKSQGVDLIVLLSHSGWKEDVELAKKVPGIDVVVGGHDHKLLEQPIVVTRTDGNTTIVDAKAYLEYLGKLEISVALGSPGKGVRVRSYEAIRVDDKIEEDATILGALRTYCTAMNGVLTNFGCPRYDEVIARGVVEIGSEDEEHPIGNLVADAMRWIAGKITGKQVDFAFVESGVLRHALKSSSGNITVYDAVSVAPLGGIPYAGPYVGSPLCTFYLYGYEVKRALELALAMGFLLQVSGLRYVYDPTGLPTMKVMKIEQITDDGKTVPIKDDELYLVCVDMWIASVIPTVNKQYPVFRIEPKYENGTPIGTEDEKTFIERVLLRNGTLIVPEWQAVVLYLKDGLSGNIPEAYSKAQGRIIAWQWFTVNPEDAAVMLSLYALGSTVQSQAASTSLKVGAAAATLLVVVAAAAAVTSRRKK